MKRMLIRGAPIVVLLAAVAVIAVVRTAAETEHGHDTEVLDIEPHAGHDHAEESPGEGDHAGHDHDPGDDPYDGHTEGRTLSARDRSDAGIEIAAAGPGKLTLRTNLLGQVRINEERLAHVVPPVSGVVREVGVRVGDDVQAGQLLAVIASRELAGARAEFLSARGRRALAEIAHEREKELWERHILIEQDYLDAKQALSEADIELEAAEQALHALGVTEEELEALESNHEAGALTRYELRAPIRGTVIEMHMVRGETVGEGDDLLLVADLTTAWVDLDVPQADLLTVREGQDITISASGMDVPQVNGVVSFVSQVIDEGARTALARVEITNASGEWRPGLFVRATLSSEQLEVPVLIPKQAVQSLGGESVVFVPDGEAFESVPVTLGRSNGSHVEILEGLESGSAYVSRGAFELKAEIVTSGMDSHAGHGH